jgi:4-amino-4-deoxy-L-arabinose transferase-like glycosyltransferase
MRLRLGGYAGAGLGLAAIGIAIRVNNALHYPPRWGFDAMFNERYVGRLLESWALPAPDADWSTAHPPLYYYLSAVIGRALGCADSLMTIVPTRLAGTLAGLSTIALAVALVRRVDPACGRRALLAAALLLFLPVHIYMSAMVNEEILASALVSAALFGVAWQLTSPSRRDRAGLGAAAVGFAAGLALLTKLSGVLVVAAAALSYSIDGLRRR